MKIMKKLLSVLIACLLLLTIMPLVETNVSATTYEHAMFPMQYLNISQGVNGSFSHQGTNAIDITGKDSGIDSAYAPFTGVVKRIYKNYVVWLESCNPVVFANGTVDYMTIMVMHDNNTSDLYVGKTIKQGERFFEEGTTGYATGNHIHLECAKGKFQGNGWYKNSNGQWMIYNSIVPYNALYLSPNTIVKNGYGYNWKTYSTTSQIQNYNLTPGKYFIRNKAGGYLNVAYGKDEDKTTIHNYTFGNYDSQVYNITKKSDGYQMMPLTSTTRVVNAYCTTVSSGKTVNLYHIVNDGTQWWNFQQIGSGFVIRNAQNPNVCITPSSSGLIVSEYTGADSQIWFLEKACTISYNANSGSGAPSAHRVRSGYSSTISSKKPTRSGYTFLGWSTAKNATTAKYKSGSTITVSSNITLYAVWKAKYTAKISKLSAALYGHDDVKLSWSKATGAKAYNIYYKKSGDSKYTYLTKTSSTSYKKANLADGKKYTFKVVPCKYENGKYYASSNYKTVSIYTLKKTSTPSIKKYSNGKVQVSWGNIAGGSGYQISMSTSKNGTRIVSTYSTTTGKYKIIKATKGKTYYYKVRAYKTVNGKKIYGPWSSVKSYKLK